MCSLLAVSLWESGRVSVSHTGNSGFEHSTFFKNNIILSLNFLNSMKTFRENSIYQHPIRLIMHCVSKLTYWVFQFLTD